MSDCTLYIDESGDLGKNRGTTWFVLAGVLINKADEPEIRNTMDNIKQLFNINEIHFRNIMGFDKKSYTVSEINTCPFEYITIVANTRKMTLPEQKGCYDENPAEILYNHICSLLLERTSWLLRDTNRTADIMLASRSTHRDNNLISYIRDCLLTDQNNSIEKRFDKITAKKASSRDMLQLADICATSSFYSYERNWIGYTTPCYAYRLKPHLYQYRDDGFLNYGVKYYSEDMNPGRDYFKENSICPITDCFINDRIK